MAEKLSIIFPYFFREVVEKFPTTPYSLFFSKIKSIMAEKLSIIFPYFFGRLSGNSLRLPTPSFHQKSNQL